jgi:hypothetical protein
MRQREPYCWKRTSSVAHRSASSLRASLRSFFMRRLALRVGAGDQGTRLALPKPPSCRNSRWHWRTPRSIPQRCLMNRASVLPSHRLTPSPTSAGGSRSTADISASCSSVSRDGRPGRSPSVSPARPSASNRCTQYWTLWAEPPQQASHFPTVHTLRHQQHAMKTMVIARCLRSANLILQRQAHRLGIRHRKRLHDGLLSQ